MNKMLKWILIIFAVFVILGALGGSEEPAPTEQTKATTEDQKQTEQIKATTEAETTAQPVKTVPEATTTTVTKEVYQDDEWGTSAARFTELLASDSSMISTAANSGTADQLLEAGSYLAKDSQNALDESRKYSVSPKYQDTKNEWEAGLNDYINAGNYIVVAANDINLGNNDPENLLKATELLESANRHITRASALLSAAA